MKVDISQLTRGALLRKNGQGGAAAALKGLEAFLDDEPRLERPMSHALDLRAAVARIRVAGARGGVTCTQLARQSLETHRVNACDQESDAP